MTENTGSGEPVFNVPPVTKYMVAAIFIVHLLMLVTTPETENWVLGNFSFRPAVITAILDNPTVPNLVHLFVTLNSHMFFHHAWTHMILNAGMLLAFGSMVERHFGAAKFLVL